MKQCNIFGFENKIQNKPVDEWINQVLVSNIEPHVFYFDPKIIQIPGSEKVIVVIQVPESTKKPHIVSDWGTYHLRINDSIKPARHSQIRDMFEFSKNRENEGGHALLVVARLAQRSSLQCSRATGTQYSGRIVATECRRSSGVQTSQTCMKRLGAQASQLRAAAWMLSRVRFCPGMPTRHGSIGEPDRGRDADAPAQVDKGQRRFRHHLFVLRPGPPLLAAGK